MRLTAASFDCTFSPFSYQTLFGDHAAQAWLLGAALLALAVLVWLVLRHGDDMLWLASGDGGVLVCAADLERPAGVAAAGCHADVVRAEIELFKRGGALRARARVSARPLADVAALKAAVDQAVRTAVVQLAGRDLERLDIRIRVLTVPQLARHLP